MLPNGAGFYHVMELADSVGKGGDGVLGIGSGEIAAPDAKPKSQDPKSQTLVATSPELFASS